MLLRNACCLSSQYIVLGFQAAPRHWEQTNNYLKRKSALLLLELGTRVPHWECGLPSLRQPLSWGRNGAGASRNATERSYHFRVAFSVIQSSLWCHWPLTNRQSSKWVLTVSLIFLSFYGRTSVPICLPCHCGWPPSLHWMLPPEHILFPASCYSAEYYSSSLAPYVLPFWNATHLYQDLSSTLRVKETFKVPGRDYPTAQCHPSRQPCWTELLASLFFKIPRLFLQQSLPLCSGVCRHSLLSLFTSLPG